jgi:hypothetical protein
MQHCTIELNETHDPKKWLRLASLKVPFKLMSASILILLSLPIASSTFAYEEFSPEEAKAKLDEAFEAVAEAERMGGNVSNLVAELNEAVMLIEEGEDCGNETLIAEAVLKAEDVLTKAPALEQEGAASIRMHMIQSGLVLSLVVALAIIVWQYGPWMFWRLWIKSKSSWRVKSANR